MTQWKVVRIEGKSAASVEAQLNALEQSGYEVFKIVPQNGHILIIARTK